MKTQVVSIYFESESASEAERESDEQSESEYQGGLGVVGNSNTTLLFDAEGESFAFDHLKVIR